MILQLLYVGFAVENVNQTRRAFRDLMGLPSEYMDPDTYLGTDNGARIAFPNDCWLYVMDSKQSESSIAHYVQTKGPGLERVAFLSDSIMDEFERVCQAGVPLVESDLADTPQGLRFTVPAEYVSGVAVEVIQPAPGRWKYNGPRNINGVLGLQHIGVAVKNLQATSDRFRELLDLSASHLRTDQHGGEQKDVMICPGNDRLWMHVTESWGENARVRQYLDRAGEGLEHICIEVYDIREAVTRVSVAGAPLFDHKIYTNRPDGFEAFIYPEYSTGVTIELIEPYPTSRGYRPNKASSSSS